MNTIASLDARPYQLKNKIQHYTWGDRGDAAFIPNLLGIEAEPETPYAELWMGAHPNASSEILLDSGPVSLRELISQYPLEILGASVAERFSGTLPFLFKVLSIGESLSIQAHPNKAQAEALHAHDPKHYPDNNHKPEIAVALDSLTALMGFTRFSEILQTLKQYPEVAGYIGQNVVDRLERSPVPSPARQRDLVRSMYAVLLKCSVTHKQELYQAIDRLYERLRAARAPLKEKEQIFVDLRKKYTGADVGLFSIFLLNLVHLKKGQAVFIKAGVPHAYLKGNIVECMANSDNVVRAGLTPKFKDTETLIDILTYETGSADILGDGSDQAEIIYQVPVAEFQLSRWQMSPGEQRKQLTDDSPQILLVTEGEILIRWGDETQRDANIFRTGQSILIPAFLKEYQIVSQHPTELFGTSVPLK